MSRDFQISASLAYFVFANNNRTDFSSVIQQFTSSSRLVLHLFFVYSNSIVQNSATDNISHVHVLINPYENSSFPAPHRLLSIHAAQQTIVCIQGMSFHVRHFVRYHRN